eukprot:7384831-Prymnesium_polylepis.1
MSLYADAHLCGVTIPRLREWVSLMELGEMDAWGAEGKVKAGLEAVLQEMDALDTEWSVQMVVLAMDLSAAYDAFHSQNRNARSGMGNFTSRAMGLVLLCVVLDKHRTPG